MCLISLIATLKVESKPKHFFVFKKLVRKWKYYRSLASKKNDDALRIKWDLKWNDPWCFFQIHTKWQTKYIIKMHFGFRKMTKYVTSENTFLFAMLCYLFWYALLQYDITLIYLVIFYNLYRSPINVRPHRNSLLR